MRKLFFLTCLCSILCGCISNNSVFNQAKNMVHNGEAECVVIKDNSIVATAKGRGISPLLNLYDEKGELLQGSIIVDKVIGRAAAFITIKSGAVQVYGKIMSEDALMLLNEHKIKASYNLLVPRILNNQKNGLCPLEDSVEGIVYPDNAIGAMRQRIIELRKGK